MNAGTALGLLAGLGAMNAMSGKPYGGKRFTGLLDMLDGGGAGQSGDKFEGGGLLSMLGNLFMKPLEAQQRVEEIAARTSARDRSSSPKPVLRPQTQADAEAAMGLDPFGGVGPTVTPPDVLGSSRGLLAAQAANEAAMGLDPFGGTGPMTYSGRGNVGMPSKEDLIYSGRGNYGMPAKENLVYSGRGTMAGADRPVEYSGRGTTMGGPALKPYVGPVPVADVNDDAMMTKFIDDLLELQPDAIQELDQSAMQDLYITYVQNGGKFY